MSDQLVIMIWALGIKEIREKLARFSPGRTFMKGPTTLDADLKVKDITL